MFAKHLPPSAGRPRVLALDQGTQTELGGMADVSVAGGAADTLPTGPFDAVAGHASPESVARLIEQLRPGGRLILAAAGSPETLLEALTQAGLIHCLVEPLGPLTLYRGERPPLGAPLERHTRLADPLPTVTDPLPVTDAAVLTQRFIFLLITQTPNKPAWKLSPGDPIEWRAATVQHPATGESVLLVFSGLVRAVAFMQSAVLAGSIQGVNKVGKFLVQAARGWGLPLALNPEFESVRGLEPGPSLPVDPAAAITGEG